MRHIDPLKYPNRGKSLKVPAILYRWKNLREVLKNFVQTFILSACILILH